MSNRIELIPAIDIIDGKCVRLTKGDYGQKTIYNDNPADVARRFEEMGFKRLHVVDLDGAKSRHIVNDAALRSITSTTNLKVDFGGGIKTTEDIARAFDAGAAMVTIGSVAVTCPELFMGWLDTYGADRLILGADVRNGMISINGWKEDSAEELLPFLKQYVDKGVRNVLCTDISKDGTLQGPATGLYRQIMDAYPTLHLIASGGVGSNEDIKALADSGMQTITIAPEAGSDDMRAVINKGIEEEHLYNTIRLGVAAGIRHFRMYIMVGLPWEKPEDIDAIAELTHRLKDFMETEGSRGTFTLSVNPFIPKPFTPFQWLPMADKKTLEESLKRLNAGLKKRKGIELKTESLKEAYIQGVLARGDSRIGELLCRSYEERGAEASKAFLRTLKDEGIDAGFYLYRERGQEEIFPWEMIDIGVRREYLLAELENARQRKFTKMCFDGCRRCGVCAQV